MTRSVYLWKSRNSRIRGNYDLDPKKHIHPTQAGNFSESKGIYKNQFIPPLNITIAKPNTPSLKQ